MTSVAIPRSMTSILDIENHSTRLLGYPVGWRDILAASLGEHGVHFGVHAWVEPLNLGWYQVPRADYEQFLWLNRQVADVGWDDDVPDDAPSTGMERIYYPDTDPGWGAHIVSPSLITQAEQVEAPKTQDVGLNCETLPLSGFAINSLLESGISGMRLVFATASLAEADAFSVLVGVTQNTPRFVPVEDLCLSPWSYWRWMQLQGIKARQPLKNIVEPVLSVPAVLDDRFDTFPG